MRLTIKCGVVNLTKKKRELLDAEYNNLQIVLKGGEAPLYSANRQQAFRYYRKIKMREYPLSIRNDLLDIRKTKTFTFVKIPVHGIRGGLKLPIKPHREIPDGKLCESKLIRRTGKYILNLTIEIESKFKNSFSSILAIDVGERTPATAVLLRDETVMKTMFLGREVRGIRRHYAWLRKRLQEKKLNSVVKRIGNTEQRKVNDVLHKVSKTLVDFAEQNDACIVLGNLKGIRKQKSKGRRLNRIINSMPFHKLRNMIEYKAELKGIPVVSESEYETSKHCHVCGLEGKRKTQGQFNCPLCGEYNADLNGAINIGKRFLPYMDGNGATCGLALNRADESNYDSALEATVFKRW